VTASLEIRRDDICRWIRPSDVADWGIPTDELWTIARHNLRRTQPEPQFGAKGFSIVGDEYTGSHLIRLTELIGVPENGLLVNVANPFAVIVFPLLDASSLANPMLIMTQHRAHGAVSNPSLPLLSMRDLPMPDVNLPPAARLSEVWLWLRPDGRFEDVSMSEGSSKEPVLKCSPQLAAVITRLGGLGS
jgi:hypothetical protein